jgi:16S rRNA (uracil1498-N3)-methyltransferase
MRLFIPSLHKAQNEFALDESTSRYLIKVLRLENGARFTGFDASGVQYQLELKAAHLPQALVKVQSRNDAKANSGSLSITLGQSLPKASKMDLILRQGTETGVHRFIPLMTQRSISRPDTSQYGHKNERWQKILVEACRQCGRNDVPKLDTIRDWRQTLELFGEFDLVLIPYENEAPTLRTVLESHPDGKKILFLIGPEGGWTPEEISEARDRGAFPVHLPTPILRTETAGLAVAAMIQYELGDG